MSQTCAIKALSSAINMHDMREFVDHFNKQKGKIISVFLYPTETKAVFQFSDNSYLSYTRFKDGRNHFVPIQSTKENIQ